MRRFFLSLVLVLAIATGAFAQGFSPMNEPPTSSATQTLLDAKVPYTGATNGLNLGSQTLTTTGATTLGSTTLGSAVSGANLTINATSGTELITAPMVTGGWTLGFDTGGWSITAGVLSKTASTGTQTATAVTGMTSAPTAGVTYRVTIVSSAASGTTTWTMGGVTGTTISSATTTTDYITATSTAKIVFNGVAASTVSLTSVSIVALTANTGSLTVQGPLKIGSPIQNIKGQNLIVPGPAGTIRFSGTNFTLSDDGALALLGNGLISVPAGKQIQNVNGDSFLRFNTNAAYLGGATHYAYVTTNGVGIDKTTPAHALDVAGNIRGGIPIVPKSTGTTLTELELNSRVRVTAAVTTKLPAVSTLTVGEWVEPYSSAANVIRINPDDADAIVLDGASCGAGVDIYSDGTAGAAIHLYYDTAGQWMVLGRQNVWACGS